MARTSLAILLFFGLVSISLAVRSPWERLQTTNANPVPNVGAHEAVAVGKKIYLFGGLTEDRSIDYPAAWTSFSNTLRVFDTVTNTWSVPTTTGPVPPSRAWFAMAAVGTNLYIFGGQQFDVLHPLGDFYRFDTLTNTWYNLTKTSGAYPLNAQGPQMTSINGKLYLFGGLNDFFSGSNELWRYTPLTDTWTAMPTPNGVRPVGRALPEVKEYRGNLVIFGGEWFNASFGYYQYRTDMFEYHLDSNQWTERIPHTPIERRRLHYASVIVNGEWHFHGGDYGSCPQLDLLVPETALYNLRTNEWREGYLPHYANGPVVKRPKFTQVGNLVYLTGGYGNIKCSNAEQQYMNDVWTYDPTNVFVALSKTFNDEDA